MKTTLGLNNIKHLLQLLNCLLPVFSLSQSNDSIASKQTISNSQESRAEVFTNGFIDIMNNGQVNASARFIRLFIGEPGKFVIPLSVYSGVSANNFQNQSFFGEQQNNESLANSFINPLSGLINISSDGVVFFNIHRRTTRAGILYHLGERVLTGYKTGVLLDPLTNIPVNFLNSFANTGLYFQTAAWERSTAKNTGIFWMAVRYHSCYTNPSQIITFLPNAQTNGIYCGYSFCLGIEINNLLNMKTIYYKYTKQPEIEYSFPIYQFSFNYSLKN